jgi:Chaperone of endosialidase
MSNLATIVNNILADSGIDDINVVVTNGSYSNPAWITALAWTKITGTPTTLSGYGITDAVPSSRTLTINGVSYDLSANRSWSIVSDVTSVNAGTGISVNQTTGAVTVTNTGVLSVNGSTGAVTGVLTTSNYNSYAPTLTGGGASGTWGINITGNAATATNANTLDGLDSTDFMRNYGLINNTDQYVNFRVMRNSNTSSVNDGMYIGYANSNGGITRIFGGGATTGELIKYSNYTYEPGSFRAPIFYDSQDTGYYLDPNSTSNLYSVNANRVQVTNDITTSSGMGRFGGWYQGTGYTGLAAEIGISSGEAYLIPYNRSTSAYGNLNIEANNIRLNGSNNSSTVDISTYANYKYRFVGGDVLQVYVSGSPSSMLLNYYGGNIILNGSGSGYTQSNTSLRAPIFYDSDDTGYYADFNSTSNSGIRLRGGLLIGPNTTWGSYLQVGGNGHVSSSYANVVTTNGNLHLDAASGRDIYLGNYVNSVIYLNTSGYTISSNGSYYNGTSAYANSAGNADTVDGYHATNAASGLAYYASNGYLNVPSWINVGTTGIFSGTNNAHLRPNQSTAYGAWEMIGSRSGWAGIWFNDSGNHLMMNNNESGHYQNGYGWQWRWYQGTIYTSRSTYGGGTEYTMLDSGNYSSWAVPIGGATLDNIYYFRTNLGGYSGSLSSARMQAYSDSNNSAFMSFHKSGVYAVNMGLDADNVLRIGGWSAAANRWELDMSGNCWVAGSMRAPIFYDSNDTSYYLDPNSSGTSLNVAGRMIGVAWTTSGRNYSNEWIEFPNYSGLYSPLNGAHFYPNNGAYGAWRMAGSRSGWNGIEFDTTSNGQISLMILLDGSTSGFYNLNHGWQTRWNNGNLYIGKGPYGGTEATALDSTNAFYAFAMNQYVRTTDNVDFSIVNVNGGAGGPTNRLRVNGSGFINGDLIATGNMYTTQLTASYIYSYDWVYAQGDIIAYYSDERLKDKKGSIENALDKISQLNGFYYTNNELAKSFGYNDEKLQIGLSAQEVQKILPEIVTLAPFDTEFDENKNPIGSKSGEDYLTLDYAKLVPLLVEAIKEQQKEINELKTLINGSSK